MINDKNPRMYESFHLFDKYSDQLLTEVITRMSRDHRIIAPTKYAVIYIHLANSIIDLLIGFVFKGTQKEERDSILKAYRQSVSHLTAIPVQMDE